MAVAPADIRAKLPEFAGLDDATIQLCLDAAGRRVYSFAWGNIADDGVIYLTGHLLKMLEQGSGMAAGPRTREKVDEVEASYVVGGYALNSALGSTVYGRYYLDLRSTVFGARKL